jgi:hypothetical protein
MDDTRTSSGTSFADDFDEFDLLLEDDEPAGTPAPKPSRASKARQQSSNASTGAAPKSRPSIRITPDWNRLAAVLFVVVVVLLLLWFVVSGIVGARREGAYKDYFGEVREIASQSTAQGDELDSILVDPNAGDRSERIARIEDLAGRADKLLVDAKAIESPDQMVGAHDWFVTSLEYRAAGLDAVQRSLSASIDAKDQAASADAVSQALARLAASDVVWADSFAVDARTQLKEDEVTGVTVPDSVFVDDLDMIGPTSVGKMLDRLEVSTSATPSGQQKVPDDGKVRGGQLEAGSVTMSPSGQPLVLGGLTEIKGGDDVTFEVPFTNQGEVQLTQVPVKITLRGEESEPMTLTGVIEVVDPGQTATAKVALDEVPNFGEVLDVDILVGPIPGEKTADNNRGSYQVQFSL